MRRLGRRAAGWAPVPPSAVAARTFNPIREIVDRLTVQPCEGKELIPLSIGDPTIFGNFGPPQGIVDSIQRDLASGQSNGYLHSSGLPAARKALAEKYTADGVRVTEEDIVLTCGCSQAIDLSMQAVLNPGDAIAIPRPSFSLYRTLAVARGFEVVTYECLPDKSWQADLASFRDAAKQCRMVLVNNPSNPCGSVWPKEHVEEVAAAANDLKVTLLADEIYADMTFGEKFTPFASVAEGPVLTVGGTAKQYMVPGWRVGWIAVTDPPDAMADIRSGLHRLSTLTLGPTSFLQSVLPELLQADQAYFRDNLAQLQQNANVFADGLAGCGLEVIHPQGAMYMMVRVDSAALGFEDDVAFSRELLREEAVFVLPGACFEAPHFFRVVIAVPAPKLAEAAKRIVSFVKRHTR